LRPRVVQQAADAIPELPFVEPVLSVPTEEPAAAPTSVFADLDAVVVEVGDLVFIRYDNEPERTFSVRLSDTINNPDEGTVHVDRAPLGAAILGASADEQVTVRIGNQTRTAVIEKIEKARDALLAAE
jgi:transcription elongation GreA/GreB family factor